MNEAKKTYLSQKDKCQICKSKKTIYLIKISVKVAKAKRTII